MNANHANEGSSLRLFAYFALIAADLPYLRSSAQICGKILFFSVSPWWVLRVLAGAGLGLIALHPQSELAKSIAH
jgi:hypothetical protein